VEIKEVEVLPLAVLDHATRLWLVSG